MFDWFGCPAGLFDLYMEVGSVQQSRVTSEQCTYIEVWVTSTFSRNCVREECRQPVRRPIYGVLKQIRELCAGKPACMIFLCDDRHDDAIRWMPAIDLLLKQMREEDLLKHTLLYTLETDGECPEGVDTLVCGCANYYMEAEAPLIRRLTAAPLLETYLQRIGENA